MGTLQGLKRSLTDPLLVEAIATFQTATPLFSPTENLLSPDTVRRLRRMDVPSTLRVLE